MVVLKFAEKREIRGEPGNARRAHVRHGRGEALVSG
jgi:hypothetical protein